MRLSPLFAPSCLVLMFLYSGVAHAQTPTAPSETLRTVEQRARHDVQFERQRATIQELNALYGERARAEGVSLEQVLNAYEAAYTAALPPKSFWKEYLPHLGWVTAVVLFVLTFFRDTLRDVLGPPLKALGDTLYDRVAGYPIFWWKALGSYRKSLVGHYKRFKIPFMADRYLDMEQIYVPLKVEGASDIDQIVDFGEVARYPRLVVTGQPGSGKSMLLRLLSLLYATKGLRKLPEQPTPILLELHRLNKDDRGVFEHLVEVFRLHKFPAADRFIKRSLERGRLMLLFDGLDEVDSGRRAAEVKKLKDFIQEYDQCRVIITCRTAVYRGEFDELADRRLQIVDFSDAQVEGFLKAWPDMPPDKSVGQLLAALDERPLIKALARRPLLLTIIAFLYTEVEDFRLPYSRADFYKRAADVLLGGLKGELNKYEAVEKQFVLEHLALYNQTKQAKNEDDRLTLERLAVLGEVRRLLPEMGRKEEDAPSILEEIVERSSLLLQLDNKSRYVFSHLTLQEYFAASALKANHAKLLEHFAADRDSWRETAKLWCGLAQDSTDFINTLFQLDSVAALECLADAKRVSPETADSVLDFFEPRLGEVSDVADPITKAFATVAAGNGPRSRRVFDYLLEALSDRSKEGRHTAAVTALSLTNSPEAARHLGRHFQTAIGAEAALIRMGDLAVPVLEELLNEDSHPSSNTVSTRDNEFAPTRRATQALAAIGTPKAVEALVRLLWHPTRAVGTFSAHVLGSQHHLPQVEGAVRALHLPPEYKQSEWYRWVWSPFEEGESTMAVIAGRIGYLIDNEPGVNNEGYTFDRRIAIPLVVHIHHAVVRSLDGTPITHPANLWKDAFSTIPTAVLPLRSYDRLDIDDLPDEKILEIFGQGRAENPARTIIKIGQHPTEIMQRPLRILSLLDIPLQVRLLYRLASNNYPTLSHWRNILRPVKFAFKGSLRLHTITLTLFMLPFLSLAGVVFAVKMSSGWLSLQNVIAAAALLTAIAAYLFTMGSNEVGTTSERYVRELLFSAFNFIRSNRNPDQIKDPSRAKSLILGALYLPLNMYLGSLFLRQWFTTMWVAAFWLLLLGHLYAFYWSGKRKERSAGNPLVGLL